MLPDTLKRVSGKVRIFTFNKYGCSEKAYEPATFVWNDEILVFGPKVMGKREGQRSFYGSISYEILESPPDESQ